MSIVVVVSLISLALVILAHIITFVWRIAKLSARVDNNEAWIARHDNLSARMSVIESQMQNLMQASRDTRDTLGKIFEKIEKL